MSDIVIDPPVAKKYETLKSRIIEQFADSETKKKKKLLEIELGDKKPSQLLLEMKNLAGDAVTNEFMKSLFIQRMPNIVRQVLSISTDDLQAIAKMAVKMLEAASDSHSHVRRNTDDFGDKNNFIYGRRPLGRFTYI